MAGRFSEIFTLKDIFNNQNLKGKLPLINYKERETDEGKISVRTSPKTVRRLVFDTSKSSARPFYKPLITSTSGDSLFIGGTLVGDENDVVNAIYTALVGIRTLLNWTANNTNIIRTALKESEANRRKYGIDTKLELRARSMMEIEGMSKPRLQALLTDIMENIFFSDNFPKTQKKYEVTQMFTGGESEYIALKEKWKRKVGAQ